MSGNGSRRMMLNRRMFFAAGGGVLGAAALAGSSTWADGNVQPRAGGRRAPNVVLVLADDLGYGELGSYGQTLIRTPHLDRLAAEGVSYTDFYAGAPVCAPSRCTLLTGLHTGHATVRQNPEPGEQDTPLDQNEITFAHLMQHMGYRTALFGKWGFSEDRPDTPSHPNEQGFDEFFGYLTHIHAHQYYPSYLWHNRERVTLPGNNGSAGGATYAPDLVTEKSLEFIDANKDDPFLLMVSTTIPHSPQQAPGTGEYAGENWGQGEKLHAAQITHMDADIGRIVDKLEALGIADDTVVIFMSDNGPHEEGQPPTNPDFFDANGPLRGYKRNLYDGGIRVPAIVWAPGHVGSKAGAEVAEPLAMWDILPTLADLTGAPVPPFVDGGSMRHTFDASAPARGDYRRPLPDRALYWWRVDPWGSPRANATEQGRVTHAAEALRQGDWKAVRIAPGKNRNIPDASWDFQLYNLASDIGETTNIASQNPEVAASMVALLKQSWTDPALQRPVWRPEGLAIVAPDALTQGEAAPVTVVLANHRKEPFTRVEVQLEVPDGWRVSAPRRNRAAIRPGDTKETVFEVVPSADATGSHELRAVARYRMGHTPMETAHAITVTLSAPPPTGSAHLSDMEWVSSQNAWGPVERDLSNGRDGAGDGPPISINGTGYAKGLGVHAPSEVVYALAGAYRRFTSVVGIDDFSANQGSNGSVVFQVWGDGTLLHDTGLVTAASGPTTLDVPIGGVDRLRLVVTDGGNGNTHDHSSWADAMVHA